MEFGLKENKGALSGGVGMYVRRILLSNQRNVVSILLIIGLFTLLFTISMITPRSERPVGGESII